MFVVIVIIAFAIGGYFLFSKKYRFVDVTKDAKLREKIILEDVLKSLYAAKQQGNSSSVNTVVRTLDFGENKVVGVLRRMEENGLIKLLDNKIRLTEEGTGYALKIIKAHRLWERYLAEKTGYDKRDWHRLAEKAEHTLTDDDVVRLTKELKKPLFDPHGSPIPYDGKSIPKLIGQPLTSYDEGTVGRIIHINDEPEIYYAKIQNENIHIGSQLKVLEKNESIIIFESEGKKHTLESLVAAGLTVIPLDADEIIKTPIHRLSDLKIGEEAKILRISKECRGETRRRLLDLGFVKGTIISVANISPMRDPVAYNLRNTLIALRNEHAQFILIEKKEL